MSRLLSRRSVLRSSAAVALATRVHPPAARAASTPALSLPIGLPGEPLGDGFIIRHGYACENTWYNPGWLHTAEDWFRLDGAETGGAEVRAVGAGQVVFVGSDYPGRVVIVRHQDDLHSMYGHLDYVTAVSEGETVATGQLLGTVLTQVGGRAPSHLHLELRTFLTTTEVNGSAPRYAVACGVECPPGPGYWPVDAPEHPSAMGWRNPTHVIASRAFDGAPPDGAEVIVASGTGTSSSLWSEPSDHADAEELGALGLNAGDRYRLLAIATGTEDSTATSAEGYRLWYRIEAPGVGPAWVQAAVPSANDTGSDGRPSSVRLDLVPAVAAD